MELGSRDYKATSSPLLLDSTGSLCVQPRGKDDLDSIGCDVSKTESARRGATQGPEFAAMGLVLVRDMKAADLIIDLDRPVFTYTFTFSVTNPESSVLVTNGKVTAFDGNLAAPKDRGSDGQAPPRRPRSSEQVTKFDAAMIRRPDPVLVLRSTGTSRHRESLKTLETGAGRSRIPT